MAAPTAQSLCRELGSRMGEFILAAPTGGSTTTLVDATLAQVLPVNVGTANAPLGCWVYGATDALGSGNRGIERRGSTYIGSTGTLSFLVAWPAVISGSGTNSHYEVYLRQSRTRLLEALNSGIRQLGYYWWRPLLDEASIVTVANTWSYSLPATVPWRTIGEIQIQVSTTPGLTGYPYVDAGPWNPAFILFTNSSGVTTYRLQFGTQPPPGRIVRIIGAVDFNDLVADADILPLGADSAGPATEWLYSWAMAQLTRWEALKQPALQTEWLEKQLASLLKEAEDLRNRLAKAPEDPRLVVPGWGDGTAGFTGGADDPGYLAAFNTMH